MNFAVVWDRIAAHAGQTFHTVTGLPFTYEVKGDAVYPSRTHYRLGRRDFEFAYQQMPVSGPGKWSATVRGASYVYAILSRLA